MRVNAAQQREDKVVTAVDNGEQESIGGERSVRSHSLVTLQLGPMLHCDYVNLPLDSHRRGGVKFALIDTDTAAYH
jgi:hypothetical protein